MCECISRKSVEFSDTQVEGISEQVTRCFSPKESLSKISVIAKLMGT